MKEIMKKLASLVLIAVLLFGCTSTDENVMNQPMGDSNVIMSTGFNEEVYVWETFIFSTNRVETIR
jgi:uncharacterized protein YcfL